MPYNNTDYMEETIIHELRKNHDLLQEILIPSKIELNVIPLKEGRLLERCF
jgi:hypothetical protein